jgi:threonine aldolase
MRAAMAAAEVGDDVYGEDPTVNELERRVAELTGHEAGLYVPSGSLGNQLGLRTLAKPGQEIICDPRAHIVRAELGAGAALAGISFRTWGEHDGHVDVDEVRGLATPDAGPYMVSTVAIALENTHNFAGGAILTAAEQEGVLAYAREAGLATHLDGARIWNAHVATGRSIRELTEPFDTVSVCLSKGLGAPVGSVLTSSAERIAEARIWRKRHGAGMRQAGILAAAGLYALEHNIDRLADDHKRARRLAEGLGIDPAAVDTNIVAVPVPDARALAAAAAAQGVLISVLGARLMRLVTHLDVDDDGIEHAIGVLGPMIG